MKELKHMKEMLTSCVQGQMAHLDSVDTKELGEAIDMIKDLSEAIYYCTITEAMEEKEEPTRYYGGDYKYPPYYDEYRDMDRMKGRMYYDDRSGGSTGHNGTSGGHTTGGNGTRYYTERELPLGEVIRDHREGRSPMMRKTYMESKELHKDKANQMHELEKYAQELTADMVEMIEDASPEEKQYLSNRLTQLAAKIK
jgi:DNA-binding transcriptional MerR regulator